MKRTLEELKDEIVEQSNEVGPYSHNIVSLLLTEIARRFGDDAANKAVRELELTRIWGIKGVTPLVTKKGRRV